MPADNALVVTQHPQPRALVTGATAGIGREFALQLAALGYDLTLVARDSGRLTELATDLQATRGVTCTAFPADLSSDDDTSRVVEYIRSHPVDVLVNNAGFGHAGRVGVMSHEKQDAMIRLHVLAVHRLTQAALPAMLERKAGSVIIVSSVASYLTSPGNVNYCATKAYDRTFAEGLALETARHGIYVQALCPGFTHTELHARAQVDKGKMPAWLWMTPDRVVAQSLAAMRAKRPTVVIPGRRYLWIVLVARYAPKWFIRLVTGRYKRDR